MNIWETVWVAFGSNMDNPIAQLQRARARLPDAQLIETGASRLYRTAPWGYEQQDDFYNAVVRYQTCLQPTALLAKLQRCEHDQGRLRPFKNAPRTLDLDILLWGHKNIASAHLTIPHPAITTRAFVLAPLADLDPQFLLLGQTITSYLQALPTDGIEVVASADWDS